MKRIFINRVLAFLLIGATLTYAGCKDYDDDIGNVQTELSETAAALQEQLGALQTARSSERGGCRDTESRSSQGSRR